MLPHKNAFLINFLSLSASCSSALCILVQLEDVCMQNKYTGNFYHHRTKFFHSFSYYLLPPPSSSYTKNRFMAAIKIIFPRIKQQWRRQNMNTLTTTVKENENKKCHKIFYSGCVRGSMSIWHRIDTEFDTL